MTWKRINVIEIDLRCLVRLTCHFFCLSSLIIFSSRFLFFQGCFCWYRRIQIFILVIFSSSFFHFVFRCSKKLVIVEIWENLFNVIRKPPPLGENWEAKRAFCYLSRPFNKMKLTWSWVLWCDQVLVKSPYHCHRRHSQLSLRLLSLHR